MSLKETVLYSCERDEVEGLEDFGCQGKTQFVVNHATVFMVRGLLTKWKQAIGYFLSSGPMQSSMLHTLLLQALVKVKETGLNVKVVVVDQGSNNRCVLEGLCGATKDRPFFLHNEDKILIMYNPPHLLKNVRINLKKSGFVINEQVIQWLYIQQFHAINVKCEIRLAPKLTSKRNDLSPFAALHVKYATLVLSHTVILLQLHR